jgi:hypothetical protein
MLTAPDAESATVVSVAVFVLVVLISADAFVVPVGVWDAFIPIERAWCQQ